MNEVVEINPGVARFLRKEAGQRTVSLFRSQGHVHPIAATVRFYNAVVGDLPKQPRRTFSHPESGRW